MKLAIIGAMELEVEALRAALEGETVTTVAGMDFCAGKLDGADVIVVRCGIGKVNAALCVQILADRFAVTHVVNTGVAGSLQASLDIGDLVISEDAVYHDMDVKIFGYEPGQVPGLPAAFRADAQMAEIALALCREVNPDIHAQPGRVVSGDQFISSPAVKDRIVSIFGGSCCEMEGAAIAHAATINNLPFLIIRAISDKADDSAQMDYPTFERAAAAHSARLVRALAAVMNEVCK